MTGSRSINRTTWILGGIIAAVGVLAVVLSSTHAAAPDTGLDWDVPAEFAPDIEQDAELIDHIVSMAISGGLKSTGDAERDRAMLKMLVPMTRLEWDYLSSVIPSPELLASGYLGHAEVVIAVLRGEVHRTGPTLPLPNLVSAAVFDNMYLAIDIASGQSFRRSMYNPGVQLPLYPDGIVAGGTSAVFREP